MYSGAPLMDLIIQLLHFEVEFKLKLNECHKRMDSGYQFEQHFSYLLNFFRKYVISFGELSDFE